MSETRRTRRDASYASRKQVRMSYFIFARFLFCNAKWIKLRVPEKSLPKWLYILKCCKFKILSRPHFLEIHLLLVTLSLPDFLFVMPSGLNWGPLEFLAKMIVLKSYQKRRTINYYGWSKNPSPLEWVTLSLPVFFL